MKKKKVRHGNLMALLLQPGEWGEEPAGTVPAAHLQSWGDSQAVSQWSQLHAELLATLP